MKSLQVHYLNKYPGGHVEASESSVRVYDVDGKLRLALNKGGDGMMHDMSEGMGLMDRHDLSPIPKDARLKKVNKAGHISDDDLAGERAELVGEFVRDGKVLSCDELTAEGYAFCEKQKVQRRPSKEVAEMEAEAEVDAPVAKKGSKKRAK